MAMSAKFRTMSKETTVFTNDSYRIHALKRNSTDRHNKTDKGKMMRLVPLIHLSIHVIFWMHTVGTAHGNTVSPPWITLSGCFNLSSSNETSNIQKNEPTQCFEMCPGYQNVGLKNMSCICNPLYTSSGIRINRLCNLPCPGKTEVFCGSDGVNNTLMSVYRRDVPLPDDTNGSSSYGYGYVVVSGSNVKYHASDNNTSMRYGFICYSDIASTSQEQCPHEQSTSFTWQGAIQECNGRSARLITVSDVSKCPTGAAFDGTYWIGIYREKPDSATSTPTTATSTSSTSSKTTLLIKPTTGSRHNHNSTTPVIEETSKASSSGGISVIAVAAPIAVIFVAILAVFASILICKKRKLLCFKDRHNSVKMDESNNDAPLEIPELISSSAPSSAPPGSTRAPFKIHNQDGRPTTARERDIQNGQSDQTVLNSNMFSTNMSNNTHNLLLSDMKDGEKRKEKREKKKIKKDKHRAVGDKEYEEIEANGNTNVDILDRRPNDSLSAVNGTTGYPNGESEDNDKKRKKKKKKRSREDSYSDDKRNNASAEPGSDFVSGHHYKRPIASASLVKVQVTGKQPDEPNDKGSDTRREKTEQHEILRETQIETLRKEYDGLFVAPAETPVIEEQIDRNIERLGRKHKEKRRKDKERVNEDGAQQEDLNLNEVHKEPNDDNIDTQKDKKKKRKKSRERSKENVLNGYNEKVDAPAGTSFLEDQTDLQNEGSNKKHKKRKRKKNKKRGDEDVAEEKGLELEKDENDDAAAH